MRWLVSAAVLAVLIMAGATIAAEPVAPVKPAATAEPPLALVPSAPAAVGHPCRDQLWCALHPLGGRLQCRVYGAMRRTGHWLRHIVCPCR